MATHHAAGAAFSVLLHLARTSSFYIHISNIIEAMVHGKGWWIAHGAEEKEMGFDTAEMGG